MYKIFHCMKNRKLKVNRLILGDRETAFNLLNSQKHIENFNWRWAEFVENGIILGTGWICVQLALISSISLLHVCVNGHKVKRLATIKSYNSVCG